MSNQLFKEQGSDIKQIFQGKLMTKKMWKGGHNGGNYEEVKDVELSWQHGMGSRVKQDILVEEKNPPKVIHGDMSIWLHGGMGVLGWFYPRF